MDSGCTIYDKILFTKPWLIVTSVLMSQIFTLLPHRGVVELVPESPKLINLNQIAFTPDSSVLYYPKYKSFVYSLVPSVCSVLSLYCLYASYEFVDISTAMLTTTIDQPL